MHIEQRVALEIQSYGNKHTVWKIKNQNQLPPIGLDGSESVHSNHMQIMFDLINDSQWKFGFYFYQWTSTSETHLLFAFMAASERAIHHENTEPEQHRDKLLAFAALQQSMKSTPL